MLKMSLPWCSNRDTFFLLRVRCIPVRICAIPFQNWLDSCEYQLWGHSRTLLGFWGPEGHENIRINVLSLFYLHVSLSHTPSYRIGSSWPAAKVFHFFNNVVTSFVSENWEPVYIRTRLGDSQQDTNSVNNMEHTEVSKKIWNCVKLGHPVKTWGLSPFKIKSGVQEYGYWYSDI